MPPRSGGGASAPSAHAEALRQAFGAVTPLSQPAADSSPQGEPALSGDAPLSLPLRGGGTRSVTERCAAAKRRRRVSALCTRRSPAASLRCGNTSPAELDGEFYGASPLGISACADIPRILQSGAPRQLPSRGAFPLTHPTLCGRRWCIRRGGAFRCLDNWGGLTYNSRNSIKARC